jgi:hypothetical protein
MGSASPVRLHPQKPLVCYSELRPTTGLCPAPSVGHRPTKASPSLFGTPPHQGGSVPSSGFAPHDFLPAVDPLNPCHRAVHHSGSPPGHPTPHGSLLPDVEPLHPVHSNSHHTRTPGAPHRRRFCAPPHPVGGYHFRVHFNGIKSIPNFIQIRPAVLEMNHADRQTDRESSP